MYTITYDDMNWIFRSKEQLDEENEPIFLSELGDIGPTDDLTDEVEYLLDKCCTECECEYDRMHNDIPYHKVIRVDAHSPREALQVIEELMEKREIDLSDLDVASIHNSHNEACKGYPLQIHEEYSGEILLLIKGVDAFTSTVASRTTIDILELLGFTLSEDEKKAICSPNFTSGSAEKELNIFR